MTGYVLRRLGHSVMVVLAVLTVVFVLIRLEGDPTPLFLPIGATPHDVDVLRHKLGFDRPLDVQFAAYLDRAVRGDFGISLLQGQPALTVVLQRMPATFRLTLVALALMVFGAIPLGIVSAVKPNSLADLVGTVTVLVGQGVPSFWLGIILILFFAVRLEWFPAFGSEGAKALVLPGITLGAYASAIVTRLVRSSMLEILTQDFVRTATGKGVPGRRVLLKHVLRNAAIPIVTIVGLQVGTLVSGAIITEQVFGYAGMGQLVVQAVTTRDMPVVQAFVVVTATLIVLVNLAVDLLYTWLDPRVRYA